MRICKRVMARLRQKSKDKTIPKIESINRYLDSSIEELRSRIVPLPEDTNHGWEDLNRLFFSQLR